MAKTDYSCNCSSWGDRVRISLSADTATLTSDRFDTVRERNPWLALVQCKACKQKWYVATDTVDDDYYFRRLSAQEVNEILHRDAWPSDYDDFVNVWPASPGETFRARISWPWKGEHFEIL